MSQLVFVPLKQLSPASTIQALIGSATATKMSAQFALASSLLRRRLTMDDIAAFKSSETLAMSRKVEVVVDPLLSDRLSGWLCIW